MVLKGQSTDYSKATAYYFLSPFFLCLFVCLVFMYINYTKYCYLV